MVFTAASAPFSRGISLLDKGLMVVLFCIYVILTEESHGHAVVVTWRCWTVGLQRILTLVFWTRSRRRKGRLEQSLWGMQEGDLSESYLEYGLKESQSSDVCGCSTILFSALTLNSQSLQYNHTRNPRRMITVTLWGPCHKAYLRYYSPGNRMLQTRYETVQSPRHQPCLTTYHYSSEFAVCCVVFIVIRRVENCYDLEHGPRGH